MQTGIEEFLSWNKAGHRPWRRVARSYLDSNKHEEEEDEREETNEEN